MFLWWTVTVVHPRGAVAGRTQEANLGPRVQVRTFSEVGSHITLTLLHLLVAAEIRPC